MTTESMRAEFEALCCKRWHGDRDALTLNPDGEYIVGPIQFAFECYQAGRAAKAQEVPPMGDYEIRKLAKQLKMPSFMWDTQGFLEHLVRFAAAVRGGEHE